MCERTPDVAALSLANKQLEDYGSGCSALTRSALLLLLKGV